MKKLKVKTILQPKGSTDCGPACVQMILNYFGITKTLEILSKNLTRDSVVNGTYIYENGSLVLAEGLQSVLVTANPILFKRDIWNDVKKVESLKKHLNTFCKNNHDKKSVVKLLISFLDNGGKIKIKIPSIDIVKKALDDNRVIMASVYGGALGSNEGNFHFVVVSGYKEGYVFINNPKPGSKTGWFKNEDFTHAVLASSCFDIDNGSILIVG